MPSRETFSYANEGRLRVTSYPLPSGEPGERTEAELDAEGREVFKRYFRADGSQYGEETVLWNGDGSQLGWDFKRTSGAGQASFRYAYQDADAAGQWTLRTRSRDGTLEWVETRTVATTVEPGPLTTAVPFAGGVISTGASETSPSFTADGRTMVFARYGEQWDQKEPFIARLNDEGWQVEPVGIGPVYNLAIAPDGLALVYAAGPGGPLFRVTREEGGWSKPENLSELYGLEGAYPALTDSGDLLVYSATENAGDGIYLARRAEAGFGPLAPLYVPANGTTFDGFARDVSEQLLVTRCLDDSCRSEGDNGVWKVALGSSSPAGDKVSGLPYVWGVQPVPSLGLLVFTDGEDILAVPLASSGVDP